MEKHCASCQGGLILICMIMSNFSEIKQNVFSIKLKPTVKEFS